MKKTFQCYLLLLLLLFSLPFAAKSMASSADVAFNADEAQVGFLVDNISGTEASLGVYYLSAQDKNQALWVSFRTPLGNVGTSPWLFAASLDIYTSYSHALSKIAAYGFAVGGVAGYRFLTSIPTNISVEIHYSPPIFSFGGADSYYMLETRFEMMFTPSAIGYIAYKNQRADFPGPKSELSGNEYYDVTNAAYIGIKIRF